MLRLLPLMLLASIISTLFAENARATDWASYYGWAHHGRLTASGKRFDALAMVAAHRTLPFGTKIRVMNLLNSVAIEVVIIDRGPAARTGRSLDLSLAAARRLGMTKRGVVPVRIEVLPTR